MESFLKETRLLLGKYTRAFRSCLVPRLEQFFQTSQIPVLQQLHLCEVAVAP